MAKTALYFTLLFIVLVLAQSIVFNRICLFGLAVPLVFIYFIVKLPVTLHFNWALTVSFLLGITIDVFADTQGMNALACTVIAALRRPILRLYLPRDDEMANPIPSSQSISSATFLKYAFSISLVYCILFFLIEAFSFFEPVRLLLKIVSSTVLTFVIIVAIDALTSKKKDEKRL